MRLLDQDELNQITESKDIPDPTQRLLWELHREDNRLCDRAVAEIERLRADVESLKCLLGEGGKIAEIERLRNLVAVVWEHADSSLRDPQLIEEIERVLGHMWEE